MRAARAGAGDWIRHAKFFVRDFAAAAADETFHRIDGARGFDGAKTLRGAADDGRAFAREVYDRWREALAVEAGDDVGNACVNSGDQRIGCS
jgi:hypothetical protein